VAAALWRVFATTDPEILAKSLAATEVAIFKRLLELTARGDASDERLDIARAIDVVLTLKILKTLDECQDSACWFARRTPWKCAGPRRSFRKKLSNSLRRERHDDEGGPSASAMIWQRQISAASPLPEECPQ
jgi:hypothetical protein